MSLIKQFPEIESFFKQDRFSQENLDWLIQSIEKKYTDFIIINSAKTFIKLELLKFDLQKIIKIKEKHLRNKKYQESPRPEKRIPLPCQILPLCQKLEWRTTFLLKILKQKNIYKNEDDLLASEEIALIKPMIDARLKGIKRKLKEEKNAKSPPCKKSKDRISSSGDSLYDKLSLYGPGKLIYIRSR